MGMQISQSCTLCMHLKYANNTLNRNSTDKMFKVYGSAQNKICLKIQYIPSKVAGDIKCEDLAGLEKEDKFTRLVSIP